VVWTGEGEEGEEGGEERKKATRMVAVALKGGVTCAATAIGARGCADMSMFLAGTSAGKATRGERDEERGGERVRWVGSGRVAG